MRRLVGRRPVCPRGDLLDPTRLGIGQRRRRSRSPTSGRWSPPLLVVTGASPPRCVDPGRRVPPARRHRRDRRSSTLSCRSRSTPTSSSSLWIGPGRRRHRRLAARDRAAVLAVHRGSAAALMAGADDRRVGASSRRRPGPGGRRRRQPPLLPRLAARVRRDRARALASAPRHRAVRAAGRPGSGSPPARTVVYAVSVGDRGGASSAMVGGVDRRSRSSPSRPRSP